MDVIDERAEALKREGNSLYSAHDYAGAAAKYSDVRNYCFLLSY